MVSLRKGKGAKCRVKSRYIHPSQLIRERFANLPNDHELVDCLITGRGDRVVRQKVQKCIILTHADVTDGNGAPLMMHCVERWVKVTEEGPDQDFFDAAETGAHDPLQQEEEHPPAPAVLINAMNSVYTNDEQEMYASLDGIVELDDDNLPAPENVVVGGGDSNACVWEDWGHDGICPRKTAATRDMKAGLAVNIDTTGWVYLQLFEIFFPTQFTKDVLLPMVNAGLQEDSKPTLSYGEWLRWIGVWFLLATTDGSPKRRCFWESTAPSRFDGAPFRVNDLMSRDRFEAILYAVKLTDKQPPAQKDCFWEVWDLIAAWKRNMEEQFIPGWINCLDESVMKWLNQWTCPGFMVIPRKPWPFGNEWHDIVCGSSKILWNLELREGKDRPSWHEPKEYENLGVTVGLMMRICKPIYHSGRVVVMDSGFCVLEGISRLRQKGVFGQAIIKKRRCWPKHIDGDAVTMRFVDKEVGDVDTRRGKLNGQTVFLHCMKEPDYVLMMMSSFGTEERMGEMKTRNWKSGSGSNEQRHNKIIQYPELVHNHYQHRDAVDSHNARRMQPIALEEVWQTNRWDIRVLTFLLAVTAVNCSNGSVYFGGLKEDEELNHRRKLAKELIFNKYLGYKEGETPRKMRKRKLEHELARIPNGKKFNKSGGFTKCKDPYQVWTCLCRKARVRTYCLCSPGQLLCVECYANHRVEVALSDSRDA